MDVQTNRRSLMTAFAVAPAMALSIPAFASAASSKPSFTKAANAYVRHRHIVNTTRGIDDDGPEVTAYLKAWDDLAYAEPATAHDFLLKFHLMFEGGAAPREDVQEHMAESAQRLLRGGHS